MLVTLLINGTEPTPSNPTLLPVGPSFAERVKAGLERLQTSPINGADVAGWQRSCPFHQDKDASKSRIPQTCDGEPLSPPLPLVFRQLLRKKKSFSAVSTCMFAGQESAENANFKSTANKPKAAKGKDSFYQIVSGPPGRHSDESFNSISTWHSEDEDQTAPNTPWSLQNHLSTMTLG